MLTMVLSKPSWAMSVRKPSADQPCMPTPGYRRNTPHSKPHLAARKCLASSRGTNMGKQNGQLMYCEHQPSVFCSVHSDIVTRRHNPQGARIWSTLRLYHVSLCHMWQMDLLFVHVIGILPHMYLYKCGDLIHSFRHAKYANIGMPSSSCSSRNATCPGGMFCSLCSVPSAWPLAATLSPPVCLRNAWSQSAGLLTNSVDTTDAATTCSDLVVEAVC